MPKSKPLYEVCYIVWLEGKPATASLTTSFWFAGLLISIKGLQAVWSLFAEKKPRRVTTWRGKLHSGARGIKPAALAGTIELDMQAMRKSKEEKK